MNSSLILNLSREEKLKELGLDVKPEPVPMKRAVQDALAAIRAERASKQTPTMKFDEAQKAAEQASKQEPDNLSAARVEGSGFKENSSTCQIAWKTLWIPWPVKPMHPRLSR